MIYHFFANRGMVTESLVQKTIDYYRDNNTAYFRKSYVPSTFNEEQINILSKGDVDFYGLHKGRYICFECKELHGNFFSMSTLKPHQFEILKKVNEFGGCSFLIINFLSSENNVWMISTNRLLQLTENNVKRIPLNQIQNWAIQLPIEYPGIIDWLNKINELL